MKVSQLRDRLYQHEAATAAAMEQGSSGAGNRRGNPSILQQQPPPPVLYLDASRLRIGADPEIGFDVSDVSKYLYEFTRTAERVVPYVPRSPAKDIQKHFVVHKVLLWLQQEVWDNPTDLLLAFTEEGPRPERHQGAGAAAAARHPQQPGGTAPGGTSPGVWHLGPLPLLPEERNLQLLLRSHAARRWYDAVRDMEADIGVGADVRGGCMLLRTGGTGTAPGDQQYAEAVTAVRGVIGCIARSLADVVVDAAKSVGHRVPQPAVRDLQCLALQALKIGLFAQAAHPLLRLKVSPAVDPSVVSGDMWESQPAVAECHTAPGRACSSKTPTRMCPFDPNFHHAVSTISLPHRPQHQHQKQQFPGKTATNAALVCTSAGAQNSPGQHLLCVKPGAVYVESATGGPEGSSNSRCAFHEEVLLCTWDMMTAASRAPESAAARAGESAARAVAAESLTGSETTAARIVPPKAPETAAGTQPPTAPETAARIVPPK
ncbi:hypothetical protein VaNZ11_002995, partial [Volvox africanus]